VAAIGAMLLGGGAKPARAADNTEVFSTSGTDIDPAVIANTSNTEPGLQAQSFGNNGIPVAGYYFASGDNGGVPTPAIFGNVNLGPGAGVQGQNFDTGPGVFGYNAGPAGVGVSGQGYTGVGGMSTASGGRGVIGSASVDSTSVGVLGISSTGYGFQGFTSAPPPAAGAAATNTSVGGSAFVANASATTGSGIGAYVTCASAGGFGLAAYNTHAGGGYAAYFSGSVLITGALEVMGAPKNALVQDDAGSLRRMYSMESPESWFEDFGSGQLRAGAATVELPGDFAQFVRTDAYHIFLTPEGDSRGLYVSSKTSAAFVVREQQGGSSDIGFGYRLVARRKDIAGVRLERVEPPTPIPPQLPDPAALLAEGRSLSPSAPLPAPHPAR
jgi:hypothetical protein